MNRTTRLPRNLRTLGGRGGFTAVEMMVVMAIILLMVGLIVNAAIGLRPAGSRQGAVTQMMQILEEARMRAIENGITVYVGFADAGFPDQDKRLCSYILFQDTYTPDQIAAMPKPPSPVPRIPLSGWETLPTGFYLDATAPGSLLQDSTASITVTGLPMDPTTVWAIAFNSLGQVIAPVDGTVRVAVTEARSAGGADGQLIKLPGSDGSRFYIQVNRLTGRVQYKETPLLP